MSGISKRIIAIAAAVLLIAFTAFHIIRASHKVDIPKGTVGTTAGNLYNDGLFCEDGGKIYFSNSYDEGCLYVMNPDHSEMKKLYNLKSKFINVGGDFVFFYGKAISQSQGIGSVVAKPGMYMINKNGKNLLALTKDSSQCMLLVDDYIYYQHYSPKGGADFERLNLHKRESEPCLDYFITPASYYGGNIYFNGQYQDHHLYTYNITSGEVTDVWGGDIWNPICTGDYVYYMDVLHNYRLCRYSFSANSIEVLTQDRIDFYNIYGNIIYYQKSSSTDPGLHRMNIDGSNNVLIAQGVYNSINITAQYTYFKEFGNDVTTYYTPTSGSVDVREFTAARDAAIENIKKNK